MNKLSIEINNYFLHSSLPKSKTIEYILGFSPTREKMVILISTYTSERMTNISSFTRFKETINEFVCSNQRKLKKCIKNNYNNFAIE